MEEEDHDDDDDDDDVPTVLDDDDDTELNYDDDDYTVLDEEEAVSDEQLMFGDTSSATDKSVFEQILARLKIYPIDIKKKLRCGKPNHNIADLLNLYENETMSETDQGNRPYCFIHAGCQSVVKLFDAIIKCYIRRMYNTIYKINLVTKNGGTTDKRAKINHPKKAQTRRQNVDEFKKKKKFITLVKDVMYFFLFQLFFEKTNMSCNDGGYPSVVMFILLQHLINDEFDIEGIKITLNGERQGVFKTASDITNLLSISPASAIVEFLINQFKRIMTGKKIVVVELSTFNKESINSIIRAFNPGKLTNYLAFGMPVTSAIASSLKGKPYSWGDRFRSLWYNFSKHFSKAREPVHGSHAVTIVSHDSKNNYVFKNSWENYKKNEINLSMLLDAANCSGSPLSVSGFLIINDKSEGSKVIGLKIDELKDTHVFNFGEMMVDSEGMLVPHGNVRRGDYYIDKSKIQEYSTTSKQCKMEAGKYNKTRKKKRSHK